MRHLSGVTNYCNIICQGVVCVFTRDCVFSVGVASTQKCTPVSPLPSFGALIVTPVRLCKCQCWLRTVAYAAPLFDCVVSPPFHGHFYSVKSGPHYPPVLRLQLLAACCTFHPSHTRQSVLTLLPFYEHRYNVVPTKRSTRMCLQWPRRCKSTAIGQNFTVL